MALFTVELSDEDRAELERWRVQLGCRSHAETVRALIRRRTEIARIGAFPADAYLAHKEAQDSVPVHQRKSFNPQPKKGKK